MSEMVKYLLENGELNQLNQGIEKHIEEKKKMAEKPKHIENVQEVDEIITNNKKSNLVSVSSRYNFSHFKEAYENNSRNL